MSASALAYDYLENLSGATFQRLYRQPASVLAVFRRMLSNLAQTIVMSMLFMGAPFREEDLHAWIKPQCIAQRERALSILQSLHIITVSRDINGVMYELSSSFARSLLDAITGSGTSGESFGVPCSVPQEYAKVTPEFLDRFARNQWESILYFLVGYSGTGILPTDSSISSGTKRLLELGGFTDLHDKKVVITQSGFSFLLQEVNAQVWSLLIVYLENCVNLNMDNVDVLTFFFLLGSLQLAQPYATRNLSPTQLQMLEDLADFGLVYRPTPQSEFFYPTRLATTLTSDASAITFNSITSDDDDPTDTTSDALNNRSFIIIETNYRIYAYTSSLLQIAILDLFVKLHTRFPNLVTGKLTRDSVGRALSLGITADQIISYLSYHAHPQMLKSTPILPPTVVDQIRLWQIEGDRMTCTSGYLMKQFTAQVDYESVRDYANALGVLVWYSDARKCFFVSRIEQLKSYLINRQHQSSSKGKDDKKVG